MAPPEAAILEWAEVGSEVTAAAPAGGCGDLGRSGGDTALLAFAKPLGAGCGKSCGEKHAGGTGWSPPHQPLSWLH